MRYIPLYSLFGLLALFCTSCLQETLTESTKGSFQITLLDKTEAIDVQTKASPLKLPASIADEFHLTITKESNGFVLYEGGYTDEPIPAAAALYTLEATFGENHILEINSPYFVGEASGVEVKANEPTLVELPCRLANALTSVRFGEQDVNRPKFDELYAPGYGVKIAIGHYSTVLTDSMKVAYYKAGTRPAEVSLSFVGVIKGNGQEVEYPLTTDVFPVLGQADSYRAGAHIRLVLDLAPMATGLIPTIVSAEVNQETIEETFPMEWLPKPQVEARGDFDSNNKILFYETEQPSGSIKFNSALGLQELKFTIDFNDPTYSALNGDYTLSTMPEAQKQAFAEAGISLPVLDNSAANDSIGVTELMKKLTYTTNESKEVANVIRLTEVKANNKYVENLGGYTLSIKQKPAFKVSVQDYNIWSKEFTADKATVTSDDPEAVYAGIVYQYSEDDRNTWNVCNDCNTANYHYRQAFSNHPSNRSIWVRAIFRGFESNRVMIDMEEPKPLPNGNMDTWTTTTRQTAIDASSRVENRPYYLPWGGNVEHWWDTNNNQTMPTSTSAQYIEVKSFPSTMFESPGNASSGKAAVIRTLNIGWWNSRAVTGTDYRGVLYVGETDNDGNMVEGRSWLYRPTALSFDYKYQSYDNERFGVYVELFSEETKIASGSYESINNQSFSSYQSKTIQLSYTNTKLKATTIKIKFTSVAINDDPAVDSSVTIYLPDGTKTWTHAGSCLTVDNIQLIYDK